MNRKNRQKISTATPRKCAHCITHTPESVPKIDSGSRNIFFLFSCFLPVNRIIYNEIHVVAQFIATGARTSYIEESSRSIKRIHILCVSVKYRGNDEICHHIHSKPFAEMTKQLHTIRAVVACMQFYMESSRKPARGETLTHTHGHAHKHTNTTECYVMYRASWARICRFGHLVGTLCAAKIEWQQRKNRILKTQFLVDARNQPRIKFSFFVTFTFRRRSDRSQRKEEEEKLKKKKKSSVLSNCDGPSRRAPSHQSLFCCALTSKLVYLLRFARFTVSSCFFVVVFASFRFVYSYFLLFSHFATQTKFHFRISFTTYYVPRLTLTER